MNKIVAVSTAAAIPTVAPAMPAGKLSSNDQRLIEAAAGMIAASEAIEKLHRAYGDDADSRSDYADAQDLWWEHIGTLIDVPASSLAGINAKARALKHRELIEDSYYHPMVAASLADDVEEVGKSAIGFGAATELPQTAKSEALALAERCREGNRRWGILYNKLEHAEAAARDQFGGRPDGLIAWRNYSAIGDSGIEDARNQFIHEGIDEKVVQSEYRAAKARARNARRAGDAWDQRAGLSELRKEFENNVSETRAAWKALGKIPLATPKDAAVILEILRERVRKYDELSEDWELAAFLHASRFLVRAAG